MKLKKEIALNKRKYFLAALLMEIQQFEIDQTILTKEL